MGSKLDAKHEKILRQLQKEPGNKKCINCESWGPTYVFADAGVFVCTECSSQHIKLGHRVKSVSMGTFKPEEVQKMQNGGNLAAQDIWLATWRETAMPKPVSKDPNQVRNWIRAVYVDKRFYDASGKAGAAQKEAEAQAQKEREAAQADQAAPTKVITSLSTKQATPKQDVSLIDMMDSPPKQVAQQQAAFNAFGQPAQQAGGGGWDAFGGGAIQAAPQQAGPQQGGWDAFGGGAGGGGTGGLQQAQGAGQGWNAFGGGGQQQQQQMTQQQQSYGQPQGQQQTGAPGQQLQGQQPNAATGGWASFGGGAAPGGVQQQPNNQGNAIGLQQQFEQMQVGQQMPATNIQQQQGNMMLPQQQQAAFGQPFNQQQPSSNHFNQQGQLHGQVANAFGAQGMGAFQHPNMGAQQQGAPFGVPQASAQQQQQQQAGQMTGGMGFNNNVGGVGAQPPMPGLMPNNATGQPMPGFVPVDPVNNSADARTSRPAIAEGLFEDPTVVAGGWLRNPQEQAPQSQQGFGQAAGVMGMGPGLAGGFGGVASPSAAPWGGGFSAQTASVPSGNPFGPASVSGSGSGEGGFGSRGPSQSTIPGGYFSTNPQAAQQQFGASAYNPQAALQSAGYTPAAANQALSSAQAQAQGGAGGEEAKDAFSDLMVTKPAVNESVVPKGPPMQAGRASVSDGFGGETGWGQAAGAQQQQGQQQQMQQQPNMAGYSNAQAGNSVGGFNNQGMQQNTQQQQVAPQGEQAAGGWAAFGGGNPATASNTVATFGQGSAHTGNGPTPSASLDPQQQQQVTNALSKTQNDVIGLTHVVAMLSAQVIGTPIPQSPPQLDKQLITQLGSKSVPDRIAIVTELFTQKLLMLDALPVAELPQAKAQRKNMIEAINTQCHQLDSLKAKVTDGASNTSTGQAPGGPGGQQTTVGGMLQQQQQQNQFGQPIQSPSNTMGGHQLGGMMGQPGAPNSGIQQGVNGVVGGGMGGGVMGTGPAVGMPAQQQPATGGAGFGGMASGGGAQQLTQGFGQAGVQQQMGGMQQPTALGMQQPTAYQQSPNMQAPGVVPGMQGSPGGFGQQQLNMQKQSAGLQQQQYQPQQMGDSFGVVGATSAGGQGAVGNPFM